MTPTRFSTVPVPATLIAAAFDLLARLPAGSPLHHSLLIAMARSISCHDREMPALLVRIRAAAIVFNDPRWLAWAQVFKTCDAKVHRALDFAILSIIAELPLNAALRFEPDGFFCALLVMVEVRGRG